MFFVLGEYVRNRSLLDEMIIRQLDELAAETAHYTHLVAEENGRGINLYKGKGEAAVGDDYQRAKRQQRDYLHITASGKAILAYLPHERVESIVDRHGLPRRTANTITDRDELFDHLATVREQGYALNDEEEIEGLRAVGAPIRDRDGAVLGSISISGPTSLVDGDTFYEDLPERVMETANIIEVNRNMSDRRSDIETLI
jgi:DNA-binding IclR family transcriptional regulator